MPQFYLVINLDNRPFNPFQVTYSSIWSMMQPSPMTRHHFFCASMLPSPILPQIYNRPPALLNLERYLLLELMLETLLENTTIEQHVNDLDRHTFENSIQHAEFRYNDLHVPVTKTPATTEPSAPLAHIPKPAPTKVADAKKAVNALDEEQSREFYDAVTLEPFEDPILMGTHVFERETVLGCTENGTFKNPLTRETISLSNAQSADFMLDAMIYSQPGYEEQRQSFKDNNSSLNLYVLNNIFNTWDKLHTEELSA